MQRRAATSVTAGQRAPPRATPPARAEVSYELPETTPGKYEIVLQMWKYVDYKKTPAGEFVNSRYLDVSNKVQYTI